MRTWLAWTGATFAGLTLGIGVAGALAGAAPRGWEPAGAVLAWLLWGGLTGGGQALALRLGLRSGAAWTAATAAALAVSGGWWLLPAVLQAGSPNVNALTAAVYWGVVPGALMGLAQAPLLRERTRHAGWWIAGSAAGWGLAGAVGFTLWRDPWITGMFHFYGAFLTGAMLTGAALVLLVRRWPVAGAVEVPAT